MDKENILNTNLQRLDGVSLQVWEKPGNRRKMVLGSVKSISKIFKSQTLRFVRVAPPSALSNPITASVKIIPMSSCNELSSQVLFMGDEYTGGTQERIITLTNSGDYADISIVPKYVKDKGLKNPACRIILNIDGQSVKQWVVTVYNPHYGSRLKRDPMQKGLFFTASSSGMSWQPKLVIPQKLPLTCRVVIHKSPAEVDSKYSLNTSLPLFTDFEWDNFLLSELASCPSSSCNITYKQ